MALFMDKASDPLTESEKADMAAIAAVKESAAIEFKEQGNRYVKMGKKHYSDAVDYYTKAIDQKALGDLETSVLFSNRAQVNLMLGNYRRALVDAKEAIELCPTNVKAVYRAAKACFYLDLLTEALSFCKTGLDQSPSNEDLTKLEAQVNSRIKEDENHMALVSDALSSAKCLVSAIENRGMRLGEALYQELTGLRKPTLVESNVLHWPVLLLYAEVMSTDFIEVFCETDLLAEHLDVMYSGSCEPLHWDKESNYNRDTVELYYQAGSGIPLSRNGVFRYFLEGTPGAAHEESICDENKYPENHTRNDIPIKGSNKWMKVDEKKTLVEILRQEDYIIPGIPAFYIVSKTSGFYKEFKAGKWTPP